MELSTTAKWLRFNLFAKPFDTVLTLIVVPTLLWIVFSLAHWALSIANWDVIQSSAKVLMTGIFPDEELWRAWIAAGAIGVMFALVASTAIRLTTTRLVVGLAITALLTALSVSVSQETGIKTLAVCFVTVAAWAIATRLSFVKLYSLRIAAVLCALFIALLYPVGPSRWGGLLLSVVLTICSAILTIPLGILLAFGRCSKVGSIRVLATAYIEVMRAVPLILIVYLIWIAQPLLIPSLQVPDVIRGLIGFVLFYSAFAAEYVRSGLQAVPRGQVEAAEALGFSDWDIKRIVILPQAMRVAMPGLVGNTLDIFNYAPLVFIIGLTDFQRAGQMVLANPQNSGQTYEVYAFLFVSYFAIGSVITFMARRLESHLGKGSHR
ncbi:amino acid ABC transporter permease [Rhizobium rhizogenes]|uniref:amino acid ABC transporter permease n=1 Tax=Rhizobium rhizogenes TaxID=359 RepID=UPI0015742059|nr:amino acid ABC transporter permease [Rhizobium rhizogenes]NTH22829.1 amino acid ABC transporter permease [Rhizobium rhizogenes]NTH35859.1 amino acid ABC transporter permease [Rhizobium rhizogenes]